MLRYCQINSKARFSAKKRPVVWKTRPVESCESRVNWKTLSPTPGASRPDTQEVG